MKNFTAIVKYYGRGNQFFIADEAEGLIARNCLVVYISNLMGKYQKLH